METETQQPAAPIERTFNNLLSAAVLLGILGLALALQGCAALKAYAECPPDHLRPDGRGGYYVDTWRCPR